MTDNLDRRHFIRRTSMGAAAVGALAVTGGGVFAAPSAATAAVPAAEPPPEPVLDGSDIVAHVIDARSGQISILVGTREVNYVNRDLAQQLIRATR